MKTHLFKSIFGKQMQFSRLLLASIGFILGLSIVLSTSDLYIKVNQILDPSTSGSTYLMLNKKVGLGNLFGSTGISDKQIKQLKAHPSVQDISKVNSTKFGTWLDIDLMGQGLQTEIFFESFPDRFISDKPTGFKWRKGDKTVPVIIPKDFINLYNFGYALSRGLPQISPQLAKQLQGKIIIGKRNHFKKFDLKIISFNDQIPTVIVPDSFMQYANSKFANVDKDEEKGRLVIKVDGAKSKGLDRLISKLGLETKKEPLDKDQIKIILKAVTVILLLIGTAFMLLSIINIILIYSLIISESKQEMRILIQLGYTPKMLYDFFAKRFYSMFIGQIVASLMIYGIILYIIHSFTSNLGHELNIFEWPSLLIGLVLILINIYIFKKDLNKALLKYSYL